jgi:D-3-phosphoglycerate dehydrogenase
MKRVLVTEQLADSGLEAMRGAGLEDEVRLGLAPEALLDAVGGASALVIRSATQVTAKVLEAADELVVVGRAGIGLDNVNVEAATRRGVMVVNAPQSNVLSAAEHTIALLLAQARRAAGNRLRNGEWNAPVGASSCTTDPRHVGLGKRAARAQANAFGMQLGPSTRT